MRRWIFLALLALGPLQATFAQEFNGSVPFTTSPPDAWDGISVNCRVRVYVSNTTSGLSFSSDLENVDIYYLIIRKKRIPEAQVPQQVINAIKSVSRATVDFDLYDNNTYIGSSDKGPQTFSWDRILRLPASEHYKPATTENGYKLYKSGSLNIRNVRIKSFSWVGSMAIQDYLRKMNDEVANASSDKKPEQTPSAKPVKGEETKVLINSSSSNLPAGKPSNKPGTMGNNKSGNTANAPELGISNGKYYRKGTDGKYEQISAQAYQSAKKQQTEQKKSTAAQPTTEAEPINPEHYLLKDPSAIHADNEAFRQKVEAKVNALQQSFYAAESIAASKRNMGRLTKLDGDYESVAQLEAAFQSKYSQISGEMQTLTESRNQVLSSTKEFFVAGGNDNVKAAGEVLELAGNIFNEIRAKREEARAREELQRRRQEELAKIEAKKLALLIELRQKLLNQFRDGGVPLSWHKVTSDKLYFFAYILNRNELSNKQVNAAVTNVFVVERFKDGTWPFKSSIVNELAGKGYTGAVFLSGYYGRQEQAQEMRGVFLQLSAKSEFRLKEFNHTRSAVSDQAVEDDVWGNEKAAPHSTGVADAAQQNTYQQITSRFNDLEETDSKQYYTQAYYNQLDQQEQQGAAFLLKYKNAETEITQEIYRIKEAAAEQRRKLASAAETQLEGHKLYLKAISETIKKGAANPLNGFNGFGKVWLTGRTLAEVKADLATTDSDSKMLNELEKSSPLARDYIKMDAVGGYIFREHSLNTTFSGAAYILPNGAAIAHALTDKEQQQWGTDFIVGDNLSLASSRSGQSLSKNAQKGLMAVSLENIYCAGPEKRLVAMRYNASSNGRVNVIDALKKLLGEPMLDYVNEDFTTSSFQWINGRYMITATLHQGADITKWTDLFIEDMAELTAVNAKYFTRSLDDYRLYNSAKRDKYDGGLLPTEVQHRKVNGQSCLEVKDLGATTDLYKAGMRKGDLLLSIDDFSTPSYAGFSALWNTGIAGQRKIIVQRNSQTITIHI